MIVHCSYTKLVNIEELKSHPKNPNKHSDDQITRLGLIMRYQGVRAPVVVSNLSGCVVAGHGRIEAFKRLHDEFPDEQWDMAPVSYQDFLDEEQEYLYLVSDNAIQSDWAELDLSMINADIVDIGPIDIELLGLKSFEIEPSEKVKKPRICPHCKQDINGEKKDPSDLSTEVIT